MERESVPDDAMDRLAGDRSQAHATKVARHEDALSPARDLRDRLEQSRSERVGDGTAIGGPITSPPE
jgi:hypothetical protein